MSNKETPQYTTVQIPYEYPDDTLNQTVRDINDYMLIEVWQRAVGFIGSIEGRCGYIIYERDGDEDDHLQGDPQETQTGS